MSVSSPEEEVVVVVVDDDDDEASRGTSRKLETPRSGVYLENGMKMEFLRLTENPSE